jgi:hypothetical protein
MIFDDLDWLRWLVEEVLMPLLLWWLGRWRQ